ncbi:MAG: heme ABC transporter ATP-binding protein [Halodesulfurarchaeum sp.]
MNGPTSHSSPPQAARSGGTGTPDPVVSVRDVTVRLGSVTALDGVSVTAEAGTFVGILGPNGAGKTTLLRTISGVLRPDSGQVTVAGRDVRSLSSKETSRLVAVVPQQTSIAFDFTVETVVAMGRTPYRRRFELPGTADDSPVREAMEQVDVARFADRSIDEVSGGERQRVLLARALAQDTPVLLLDEPTASLDINHQVRTLELIRELVDERDKTVLAPIHDLNLAAHYCDSLLLLGDGRRLASGTPESVLSESNLESAFDTDAVVTRHPVTGSVYVMALPEGRTESTGPRVHVVGGGGTAARLLYLLSAAGYDVSTGALNEGDADLETARLLGIDAVTLDPYESMDDADYEAVLDRVEEAAATVVADVEVGSGNVANLRAAARADSVVLVEERPFEKRNYAGAEAARLYRELADRGQVIQSESILGTVESVIEQSESGSGDDSG